jgi:cell division cycle protein 37
VEERTIIGAQKDKLTTSELPPDLAAAQEARERQAAMAKALETDAKAAAEPSSSAAKAKAALVVSGPTPQRSVHSYAEFVEEHEELLETFSHLGSLDATETMLKAKGDILLVEHASSYLLLSCLEEEMNGPGSAKMKQVARQSQVLSHISELGLSLHRPSRDVVVPFFRRIGEKEHGLAFADAVAVFVARIAARAVEKRKEMDEARARKAELGEDDEQEELSLEERLGPGGLDPVQVFATLPESLQEAFQSQDTARLKAAIASLPLEEAKHHMKRCEDSGLWVPEK